MFNTLLILCLVIGFLFLHINLFVPYSMYVDKYIYFVSDAPLNLLSNKGLHSLHKIIVNVSFIFL